MLASPEQLHDTLMRYEGAVSTVERDGDDSEEAVKELADARAALLNILKQCKVQIEAA